MINGIRASDSSGLTKGHGSKFCVGYLVGQETPKEGWGAYRLKRREYNNGEDNCLKTWNDKNQVSSQKFRQLFSLSFFLKVFFFFLVVFAQSSIILFTVLHIRFSLIFIHFSFFHLFIYLFLLHNSLLISLLPSLLYKLFSSSFFLLNQWLVFMPCWRGFEYADG